MNNERTNSQDTQALPHSLCVCVIKHSPTMSNDKKKLAYFQYKDVTTGYNIREHLTTDEVNVL